MEEDEKRRKNRVCVGIFIVRRRSIHQQRTIWLSLIIQIALFRSLNNSPARQDRRTDIFWYIYGSLSFFFFFNTSFSSDRLTYSLSILSMSPGRSLYTHIICAHIYILMRLRFYFKNFYKFHFQVVSSLKLRVK